MIIYQINTYFVAVVDELKAFNDSSGNKIHIECMWPFLFWLEESHKIQTDVEQITFKKALFFWEKSLLNNLTFKIRC